MRKVLFTIAIVVIATVTGITCYNNEKEEMSDLAKANAKALANTDLYDVPKECYRTINARSIYGEIVVVNYCGSCSLKPVSRFWDEDYCNK